MGRCGGEPSSCSVLLLPSLRLEAADKSRQPILSFVRITWRCSGGCFVGPLGFQACLPKSSAQTHGVEDNGMADTLLHIFSTHAYPGAEGGNVYALEQLYKHPHCPKHEGTNCLLLVALTACSQTSRL